MTPSVSLSLRGAVGSLTRFLRNVKLYHRRLKSRLADRTGMLATVAPHLRHHPGLGLFGLAAASVDEVDADAVATAGRRVPANLFDQRLAICPALDGLTSDVSFEPSTGLRDRITEVDGLQGRIGDVKVEIDGCGPEEKDPHPRGRGSRGRGGKLAGGGLRGAAKQHGGAEQRPRGIPHLGTPTMEEEFFHPALDPHAIEITVASLETCGAVSDRPPRRNRVKEETRVWRSE